MKEQRARIPLAGAAGYLPAAPTPSIALVSARGDFQAAPRTSLGSAQEKHSVGTSLLAELAQLSAIRGWTSIVSAREHDLNIVSTRSQLIAGRVHWIALCFAVLTIAWIAIDAAAFARALWVPLASGRMLAALAFAVIAMQTHKLRSTQAAFWYLSALFAVPVCFFIYSMGVIGSSTSTSMPVLLTSAYMYLPFIVVTGLAIFPLTFQENLLVGGSLLTAFAGALLMLGFGGPHGHALQSASIPHSQMSFSMLWPIMLVGGVAAIAGTSQLQFLLAATEQSARDALTGLYTRRSGEQLLKLLFQITERSGNELTAVFVDLDLFKTVNDRYGHDAGDRVLRAAAHSLASALRRQDVLIRWGGEEFLLLLPNTSVEAAQKMLTRLARVGLGLRPDGTMQTASLGLAERKRDETVEPQRLLELADKRMYAAKDAGRNRIIDADGMEHTFLTI